MKLGAGLWRESLLEEKGLLLQPVLRRRSSAHYLYGEGAECVFWDFAAHG